MSDQPQTPPPAPPPTGQVRKPRSRFRHLLRGLLVLLGLLLVFFACLSALVETQSGSRWLLQQVAQRLPVKFGEIQGNLIDGLDLGFIDYRDDQLHLHIDQPAFRWRLGSLLYGALSIQSLQAQQIRVELPPSQAKTDTSPAFNNWPNLRLPLRIELGKMQLQQIQIRQGDSLLQWQSLTGSLSLGTFHLRYSQLALDQGDYRLELSGSTGLSFPYDTSAQLKWRVAPRWAGADNGAAFPYAGEGQLKGDLQQLNLKAESQIPLRLLAQASTSLVDKQRTLVSKPVFELTAKWQGQQLPSAWWIPGQTAPVTDLELSAKGNWEAYSAQLHGQLQLAPPAAGNPLPPVSVSAQLEGDYRQLPRLNLELQVPQPQLAAGQPADPTTSAAEPAAAVPTPPAKVQQLRLQGQIAWLPALDWQLALEGQALNLAQLFADWPSYLSLSANSSGHYAYDQGRWQLGLEQLQLNGSLRDLNLEAKGEANYADERFSSQGLDLVYGANQAHLSGSLGQQLDLHWSLDAPLLGQLDTQLGGSLSSRGQLRGNRRLPQLQAELQAKQLAWADNHLEDFNLSLKPAPGAEPVASAAPASQPRGLVGNSSLVDKAALLDAPYALVASGRQLDLGGLRISQLSLNGQGSVDAHQLQAKLKSPQLGSLELGLKGSYSPGAVSASPATRAATTTAATAATATTTAATGARWRGQFDSVSIKLNKVPRWQLVSSKPIEVNADQVQLAAQCFTTRSNLTAALQSGEADDQPEAAADLQAASSPSAITEQLVGANKSQVSTIKRLPPPRLCFTGSWHQGQEAQLNASLGAVPLRQLYALFKPEVYLAGVVDGELHLRSGDLSLADMQGSMQLAGRDAELRYQFEGAGTEVYPWRDLRLKAELAKGKLSASAGMQWLGYGELKADAQLDLPAQKIASSRLQAQFTNLAPLETLVPLMNNLSGNLSADLSLSGPFAQPELLGQLRLQQGQAKVPRLGIDLKDMEFDLQALKGGRMELSSALTSGAGRLTLEGDFTSRSASDWQLQAHLQGDNVSLLSTPQLKLDLSPDLKLEADNSRVRLTGSALIPWARANIKTLPESTTRVSSDVVIVDEPQAQAAGAKQQLQVNVKLALGEDVTFRGFGLSAKLNGALTLNKDDQRPLLTNGYVGVTQGVYKAYGQNLKIERGRLIFQGPYENPGLDIRAQRKIEGATEETVAGLEISGTLQRPVAKVYSVPAYSESEAMLMLLSGKPPSENSRAEAAVLLGALSGMGGDTNNLTSGIANFFRVDELEIKSDKGVDQSQLMIGKYITPRLLVRYVVGLFDRLTSLGVEYQITDRLRLEAESGEKQSVDMVYKIER